MLTIQREELHEGWKKTGVKVNYPAGKENLDSKNHFGERRKKQRKKKKRATGGTPVGGRKGGEGRRSALSRLPGRR